MLIDFNSIFKDRVIYITGCGRSGTTIMGKIIGSLSPTYYLFEPDILRQPLSHIFTDGNRILRILFYDYFLPIVQVKGVNFNSEDDSYIYNYSASLSLIYRQTELGRTKAATNFILNEKPYWVIKNPEAAPILIELCNLFEGLKIINVIRNGMDVIESTVNKGWYSNNLIMQDHVTKDGCPCWADIDTLTRWREYNLYTRAAVIWRRCNEYSSIFESNPNYLQIDYDEFCNDPSLFLSYFLSKFQLKKTEITDIHLKEIRKPIKKERSFTIDNIQEPERTKFIESMKHYNYSID